MITSIVLQAVVLWCSDLFYRYEHYERRQWPLVLQGTLFLLLIVVVLHILDRQGEFVARTDFLWKAKLKTEQEEVETMRGINKILLENILPAHVAQHFLRKERSDDLYHESYSCVAVVFASIPNYKEFYDESDVNKQGLECLRLLNEIICDFDKLLLKPKFSGIEKIKTIGSTYMIASGLRPGKEEGAMVSAKSSFAEISFRILFKNLNPLTDHVLLFEFGCSYHPAATNHETCQWMAGLLETKCCGKKLSSAIIESV